MLGVMFCLANKDREGGLVKKIVYERGKGKGGGKGVKGQ